MDLMKIKQAGKKNSFQDDPFILAAVKGDLIKVKQFLKKGFSLDHADGNNVTVLMHAVENGHLLVANTLVQAGAFLNKSDYLDKAQTALMIAISKRNFPIINLLLDAGASVNALNNIGNSVIFYAVHFDCLDLVKRLVEEWAVKIDHQNRHKQTALMLAARDGRLEIAKYLVSKGVNINNQDENGITPLMHAIYMKQIKMVEYLLSLKDLEIDLKNVKGNTALHVAGNFGLLIIIQMLIKAKALVNLQNNSGQTALMGAAIKGFSEIVNSLLEAGADKTLKDKSGATALDYAKKGNCWNILRLLQSIEIVPPVVLSQNIPPVKIMNENDKIFVNNLIVSRAPRP